MKKYIGCLLLTLFVALMGWTATTQAKADSLNKYWDSPQPMGNMPSHTVPIIKTVLGITPEEYVIPNSEYIGNGAEPDRMEHNAINSGRNTGMDIDAEALRKIITKINMPESKFAESLGFSSAAITNWMRYGRIGMVAVRRIEALYGIKPELYSAKGTKAEERAEEKQEGYVILREEIKNTIREEIRAIMREELRPLITAEIKEVLKNSRMVWKES